MHDSRQEKMGWQDDKTRAPEARWDKQSVSPFPERPQPSFVDDGPIGGLRPGGAQAASKWREDGDRVLPRREIPAPTRCRLEYLPTAQFHVAAAEHRICSSLAKLVMSA